METNKPHITDSTYDIETIEDARCIDGAWQFLVKWKHYLFSSNMWVSETAFDSNEPILRFWENHKMEDYMLPSKKFFFPKKSLEMNNSITEHLYNSIYPEVTHQTITKIIGVKRVDNELILLVNVSDYHHPLKIPARAMRSISASKLIQFYESKIRV